MTNMMIMFQTLGPCDQMDSRGMDGVAEEATADAERTLNNVQ